MDAETATRFWAKVTKAEGDGCWTWNACRDRHGYGRFGIRGATRFAHRIALADHLGRELDAVEETLHLCDNPPCVRPSHLAPGTRADNAADMASKGRGWNSAKTHCPQGHLYDDENTYVDPNDGGRKCRRCQVDANRRYRQRQVSR